jgi:hypothetical protein
MNIELIDDTAYEMKQITDSIARKVIHETATKLRKLKQEFSSKIKNKALENLEKAN